MSISRETIFQNEGIIKTFLDTQKLKEFTSADPHYQTKQNQTKTKQTKNLNNMGRDSFQSNILTLHRVFSLFGR